MRILVCDDSPQMAQKLAALVEKQVSAQGISATVDVVDHEKDLYCLDYNVFDLAFLDVDMGACNGIDLARKIRASRPDAVIVFVTNDIQSAPPAYGGGAEPQGTEFGALLSGDRPAQRAGHDLSGVGHPAQLQRPQRRGESV